MLVNVNTGRIKHGFSLSKKHTKQFCFDIFIKTKLFSLVKIYNGNQSIVLVDAQETGKIER